MKIKRILLLKVITMLMISLIFITGCNKEDREAAKNIKPVIAVTIVPEKTFVEAVCGDLVDIVVLVPPGSSPESYEPSPMEMEKFKESDVYFSIGVEVEEASILPNAEGIKTIALQDKVASVYADRTFESGERDPHIWLSPKRVKVMIEAIAEEMGNLDEANKEIYQKNADNYIRQLEELDVSIKDKLIGIQNRKFLVYHPAFGYFADDYDLDMYSLEEEGKEATAIHLQDMIDLANKEGIKAIFYQEEIDSSQSKAFAEEIGGQTIQLSPLAADYIENLNKMAETIYEVMKYE